ncbi:hypothetical protein BDZ45DRAFT_747408 [Acephala macrosclerotiorum]|nr:hypothetical protein BDZ45DRAFT_747408 [Acephala macrosclerotiorum]
MDSMPWDLIGSLPFLGSASNSWSTSNPRLKRTYHEFMRSLKSNDVPNVYSHLTTKKRKMQEDLGANLKTFERWATKRKHKEQVKIVSVGGHPSRPEWGAVITILQKCFKTEMVFFKKRARKEAVDLLCWWVLYGRPLEEAGIMSFKDYAPLPPPSEMGLYEPKSEDLGSDYEAPVTRSKKSTLRSGHTSAPISRSRRGGKSRQKAGDNKNTSSATAKSQNSAFPKANTTDSDMGNLTNAFQTKFTFDEKDTEDYACIGDCSGGEIRGLGVGGETYEGRVVVVRWAVEVSHRHIVSMTQ